MTIAHPSLLILGIAFMVAVAGCRDGGTDSPVSIASPPTTSWPATQQTDHENFTVTIRPIDGTIERGRHFSLDVSIEAETDGDFEVAVDADMPAHRHGMNTQPEIVALGEDRYRVDGMLFHMAGDWVITVEVGRGTESERATFPVHIE